MSTYLELVEGVQQYYGSGSDQWLKLAKNGITSETIPIIKQVPGVTLIYNKSGTEILGYDYKNPFPGISNPITDIDSNTQTGQYGLTTYTAQVPGTAVPDGSGGLTMRSGATITSGGRVLQTVADRVSLGLAGAALGSKLGVLVDSALYQSNPEWWDEHFPSLNPDTWEQLIPGGTGGDIIRSLIGIAENGDATMYMDARLMAYAYQAMLAGGAWSGSSEDVITEPADTTGLDLSGVKFPITLCSYGSYQGTFGQGKTNRTLSSPSPYSALIYYDDQYPGGSKTTWNAGMISASPTSFEGITMVRWWNDQELERYTYPPYEVTVKGDLFYDRADVRWTYPASFKVLSGTWNDWGVVESLVDWPSVAWLLIYGDRISGHPDGLDPNPDASYNIDPSTVLNPNTGEPIGPHDSLEDVLDALQTAYPGLFNDTVTQDIPQEDGSVVTVTYVPVPYPTTDPTGNPVTYPGVDPQTAPQVDPSVRPDTAQAIVDSLIGPPAPPDTGSGDAPPAVVPTGSADALYSIYNPTEAELRSFGAWLWSPSFVDQLLKLFNDPMQSIISLHKVFCAPTIGGRGNIRVGYLDSGVPTNLVAGQYVTVECGIVRVPEYFGNVLDYDPYTRIQIYLPFVGIQPLDTGDVMRGSVSVTYHIDILTGACLVEVSVSRDGAGGTLYTYAGNASVQYPVSSGSYMGIVSSLLSIAGGVAGTIASGGALAPLAMGTASGILSARTRVQHSGGFSGNAGAMGARVPYLIISRSQSAVASTYEQMEGAPSNAPVVLGTCSGFVRCKVAHVEGIPATSGEIEEIENLLASGILV